MATITPTTSTTSSSSAALSGSGTMSSPGIGSGLDVNGIVTKLMTIERLPETLIDNKTNIIQAQLTAYGTFQGALSAFQTAAHSLSTASTFSATTTTVADPTIYTATSDSTAGIGSHNIEVVSLAQSQKLQSTAFANNSDSIGSGTLTFDFGTYTTASNVTTFSPNATKQTVSVTIPSGSGSIGAIASAINAAHAGISATVINDGTSYYLQYSATDGGTANSLRVNVSDSDGSNLDATGLSRLAYDKSSGFTSGSVAYAAPANVTIAAASNNNQFNIVLDGAAAVPVTLPDATYGSADIVAAMQTALDTAVGAGKTVVSLDTNNQLVVSSTNTGALSQLTLSSVTGNTGLASIFGNTTELSTARQMTQTAAPVNAVIKIDGTTVTKSSNIIYDAIQGVTLNLLKVSTTSGVPTTMNIAADTSGLSKNISSMVTAYNTVQTMISSLLAYDATTGQAGALQSEGTVRSIQAQLRQTMQSVVGGNTGLSTFSNIGVSFQRDGSLAFDSTKLQAILADRTKSIKTFFIGADGTSGIANRLNSVLSSFLGSSGTLAARTSGMNKTISNYAKQKAALEVRMVAIEARYRQQYTKLDTLMASMNTTSSYLTTQLANLPTVTTK